MNPNLHTYPTPEALAEALADELITLFGKSADKIFHLAISGGKTPNLLFMSLAEKYAHLPVWKTVHFWWVDERMVPSDDPESNYGTARKLLFSKIDIPKENIHPIKGENDPKAEALSYSHQMADALPFSNGWPVFDLILLGMGDDGHTASIFPDQLHLLESSQICEVAIHPQSKQKRITLTGSILNNAQKVLFVVTGAGKADKLKTILSYDKDAQFLPAAHINPSNGELAWFADQAASKADLHM
jgi:6-phosphogluconolactonase